MTDEEKKLASKAEAWSACRILSNRDGFPDDASARTVGLALKKAFSAGWQAKASEDQETIRNIGELLERAKECVALSESVYAADWLEDYETLKGKK